jgi:protein-disulfide isomerase
MLETRRSLLHLVAAGTALPLLAGLPRAARAEEDPRKTERALGNPAAKVTVIEFFSMTCPHCAAFAKETLPSIQKEMIDTGRIRYVFGDFPLDRLALDAAMLARALPAPRYEPFILQLFSTQLRWAYDRTVNQQDELWKNAAFAGMSQETFKATLGDNAFREWMIATQKDNETKFQIDSTPTFIINGRKVAGEMSYEKFSQYIAAAT